MKLLLCWWVCSPGRMCPNLHHALHWMFQCGSNQLCTQPSQSSDSARSQDLWLPLFLIFFSVNIYTAILLMIWSYWSPPNCCPPEENRVHSLFWRGSFPSHRAVEQFVLMVCLSAEKDPYTAASNLRQHSSKSETTQHCKWAVWWGKPWTSWLTSLRVICLH